MNVPPIWQPPQLSRLTGEGPPPVTWTASANAPARRPRPRQAKPPLRAPPSPRATSPRAEPSRAAFALCAARRRLGPRTPPSVPGAADSIRPPGAGEGAPRAPNRLSPGPRPAHATAPARPDPPQAAPEGAHLTPHRGRSQRRSRARRCEACTWGCGPWCLPQTRQRPDLHEGDRGAARRLAWVHLLPKSSSLAPATMTATTTPAAARWTPSSLATRL